MNFASPKIETNKKVIENGALSKISAKFSANFEILVIGLSAVQLSALDFWLLSCLKDNVFYLPGDMTCSVCK